jgi:hypothetical protein
MNTNTYTMSIISAIIWWDLKNRHYCKALYISETSLEKVIIPKVIIFGPIPEVKNMIHITKAYWIDHESVFMAGAYSAFQNTIMH